MVYTLSSKIVVKCILILKFIIITGETIRQKILETSEQKTPIFGIHQSNINEC